MFGFIFTWNAIRCETSIPVIGLYMISNNPWTKTNLQGLGKRVGKIIESSFTGIFVFAEGNDGVENK